MKKPLVTMLLMLATAAIQPLAAQQSSPAAGQAAAGAQASTQGPEIKDPAEYNAYVNAVQQTDPKAKAAALEAFLQTYPNSVMKKDAMELLMGAYQQAGDQQKTLDTAQRILQTDPTNVRALALLAYTDRMLALQGGPNAVQNAQMAAKYGQQGLSALPTMQRPTGSSDADFNKLKEETSVIFNGAAGFGALNQKDYAAAQKYLGDAVQAAGANASFLDVYQLALADLEANPVNPNGFWYMAHAIDAAPAQAKAQLTAYGKAKFDKYHGSDQGWPELLQAAAASPQLPAGFTVAPAPPPPTPAEQAADLVKSKQVKDMSFAEWQLILSSGNQQAADTVWNTIHDKPIELAAQVISVGTAKVGAKSVTQIQLAGTTDDIDAKKADITVNMNAVLPVRLTPKEGTMLQFEATPDAYTPNPFMMNMKDGELLEKEKPAPVHHTTHKPAQ